jgi:hypothetical protein
MFTRFVQMAYGDESQVIHHEQFYIINTIGFYSGKFMFTLSKIRLMILSEKKMVAR